MNYDELFPTIVSHAKEYGFIFPSSEVYENGLQAVYDYGQLGVELKRNIKTAWWKAMVQMHENIVGLDAAILMHPTVWKASGHVDAFNDPMIDNKDSKKRYRADNLIEEHIDKLLAKSRKDTAKRAKKEGWEEGSEEYNGFLHKNRNAVKAQEVQEQLATALSNDDLEGLRNIIIEQKIVCPVSGSKEWSEVRQFNLMFKTQLGATADSAMDLYLRPETAQGIFVNFLNVQKTSRMKLPFGIAQIGKAFRNEIVARQFIFRMREFEQMEMQFFIKPGTQEEWFNYWKEYRIKWHQALGIQDDRLTFHEHEKLAHYADAAEDIQFHFPMGIKELEGIHSRTDFDLKQHMEFSGKKMQYFDPEDQTSYVPYVIETSVGLDRTFLAHLCNAYEEEEVPSAKGTMEVRKVLKLHPVLAPYKVAVFPLVRKDGLPEIAREIISDLKIEHNVMYDEKDAVGRRYRRHDAIGTPFCVTVDYETKDDQCVTIRERDTMKQERIPISEVSNYVREKLSWKNILA
ncbi:glycine--tRNA ligase [Pontibacter sp. G13]|uniref:glycine--tRNA ligase n=1 Tax=Pontibacter sp. G13 TaxID=3074898 RepID=UPI00288C31AA|nr:glycine--tRNA ligase [Pontibacter sp. G13]WNJ21160.1 glycine--tRNA ligase [Pontibacter sp. G13]